MARFKTIILATTLSVLLVGCDKMSDQLKNGASEARNLVASAPERQTESKLSAYTIGYNKLLDTFGLTETAERYFKEDIAHQSPTDSISVTDGWLEQAHTLLVKARAMPGGAADVNQAADKLIGSLDAVMKRLAGLKIYYDSKAYKDDGLKRGKSEDAAMIAEFKGAIDAMKQFGGLLDRERKIATVADLARMKAKGDMLSYNTKLALQQTEQLISLFEGEAALRDAAVFAKADAQLAVLEKTLADQRTELASAKAKASATDRVDYNFEQVGDRLTSVVGDYRDMKQSRDVDDYNDMVKHYNDAIGSANDIRS